MKTTVYWTMKNGQQISIDDMDIDHLKNTLKMIIRNRQAIKEKPKFEIHGDIAQDMIDQGYLQEYEYQMGIENQTYEFELMSDAHFF